MTSFWNVRRRSSTTPSAFISSATGRLTPATDTDDMAGVTVHSWFAVPMISASDLSGFSCSPFCIYHCLTSLVHAARTNENTQIKSALLYKTRRKQHKQNTDYKLQMIHDNTCLKTFCHFINCHTVNQLFTSKGADNLLPLAAFLFHAKPKYTHTHDYCNLKKLDI